MSVFNTCRRSRNKPSNSGCPTLVEQNETSRDFSTTCRKWKRATRKVNYGRNGDNVRRRPATNGRIRCVRLTFQWIGPCYRPGSVSNTSAWVEL